MRVGFCGLGNMGLPMAARLVEAGHEVGAWNRTASKVGRLPGARRAATPAEAARGAACVITMLADAQALEEIVLGPSGVAEGLSPGAALIDMSTVGPEAARSVAARLPEGVAFLDAPVRGGPSRAARGELKILVGAHPADYDRWAPLLRVLGEPRHVGPPSSGQAAKVLNNFVGITLISVLGEALAVADALGIQGEAALALLAETPLRATLDHQWPRIEGGEPPSFRLRLAAKDLALGTGAVGDGLRVAAGALSWLLDAERDGLGERDQSSVVAFIRGAVNRPEPGAG